MHVTSRMLRPNFLAAATRARAPASARRSGLGARHIPGRAVQAFRCNAASLTSEDDATLEAEAERPTRIAQQVRRERRVTRVPGFRAAHSARCVAERFFPPPLRDARFRDARVFPSLGFPSLASLVALTARPASRHVTLHTPWRRRDTAHRFVWCSGTPGTSRARRSFFASSSKPWTPWWRFATFASRWRRRIRTSPTGSGPSSACWF